MSYNFDNDHIKYIKFSKKKYRKLLRQKKSWEHRILKGTMLKRKHMLWGIFRSYVSENKVSTNGNLFFLDGQYDYDYDEEGYYNIHNIWDIREIPILGQSTLLLDFEVYDTHFIGSNFFEDEWSFNFFTFMDIFNDWGDDNDIYPTDILSTHRLDDGFAFDLLQQL